MITESIYVGCSTAILDVNELVHRLKGVLYSDLEPIREYFDSGETSLAKFLDYLPELSESIAKSDGLTNLRSFI